MGYTDWDKLNDECEENKRNLWARMSINLMKLALDNEQEMIDRLSSEDSDKIYRIITKTLESGSNEGVCFDIMGTYKSKEDLK